MILRKVHISNFKGIEECTIELEKGFNFYKDVDELGSLYGEAGMEA